MVNYFRANPQVFVLFVICLVLGLGTFIAVLVALVQSGTTTPTGEPSGIIGAAGALLVTLGGR
jgi:proteasome assembly chaperone (PAC2) family protein